MKKAHLFQIFMLVLVLCTKAILGGYYCFICCTLKYLFSKTVASLNRDAYNEERLRYYGLNKQAYRSGNFTGNATNGNAWKIYKDITHDIDEMIDSILVKTTSPTGE